MYKKSNQLIFILFLWAIFTGAFVYLLVITINGSNKDILFPILFGLAVLLLSVTLILDLYKLRVQANVKKSGVETEAEFIDYQPTMMINNVSYYTIKYGYNVFGEYVVNKSTNCYSYEEMTYFRQNKKIRIRTNGKHSIIIEKPFEVKTTRDRDIEIEDLNNQSDFEENKQYSSKFCTQCGKKLRDSDEYCSYCGYRREE